MTLRWAPDTWVLKVSRAVNLWHTRVHRPALLPLSPLRTPPYRLHACQPLSHKVGYHGWKHIQSTKNRGRKAWLFRVNQLRHRLGLHTSALRLNTSASRWSGLSQHMSRIRSTLDSVSKAVSGTHSDLLSKIARLKPNAIQAGKEVETSPEAAAQGTTIPEPALAPEATPIPSLSDTAAAPTSTPTTASATGPDATPTPTPMPGTPTTTTLNIGQSDVTAQGPSARELREKRLRRVVATPVKPGGASKVDQAKPPENVSKSITVSKQTTPLFHPSSLYVNLDETYNYLAHHVNAYFGKAEEKIAGNKQNGASSSPSSQPGDLVPMSEAATAPAASSPKKGLGHYLSYSAPTVQAFVGNYITPLVPKFRAEPKSVAVESEKPPSTEGPAKPVEVTVNKEQKADEEKAKRLLLQREKGAKTDMSYQYCVSHVTHMLAGGFLESLFKNNPSGTSLEPETHKIIARVSVDNRTRALVQALHRASDVRVYINRVEDLSYHLMEFPETRGTAVKEKLIPCLLRLRQASDPTLKSAVRQALALVGYNNPVKGRGIRVLSIDGGGTRGLVALQTLHKLEALTGKPIYQLFDYICGVSTGAILGFMLGVFQIPLGECDDLYRKLGSDVFKQNVIVGTMKMGWNHAFYDSEPWENILKEKMGLDLMVETSRNPRCPKVAAVSTIVNRGTPLKAYVFRNYNLQPGVRSHYLGSCQHQLWQALRASSAAPGYFQEFSLGNDLHQDGGLLVNNPTALAIHECKCLWPNTPVECVVSLGTGRHETPGKNSATYTSLKTKLTNVISSATDTEEVHTMLDALLPPNTYYRFNPYMNEEIALDESRHEKLNLLQTEGLRYLERNEEKLRKAARILTRDKSSVQRLAEWAKLRADMYDRMPAFSSKL